MNEFLTVAALLIVGYSLYRARVLQNAVDAAQSVVHANTTSDIPHVQVDVSDQWMDPSTVHRLVHGQTTTFDIPGQFGVTQRNHVTVNDNQMATYGTNYSKSFT